MHTCTFQHSAHSTTGDNTGTIRSWFDQHASGTKFSNLGMWDSAFENRNLYEILLCIVDSFSDCFAHITSFAEALPYCSFAIANDNDCCERECSSSLGYFGYPVEGYHFILEFGF